MSNPTPDDIRLCRERLRWERQQCWRGRRAGLDDVMDRWHALTRRCAHPTWVRRVDASEEQCADCGSLR